jgi:hypothetical protein
MAPEQQQHQRPLAAEPSSPVRHLPAHAMPVSPGQLDTLLPGFLSRPQASPMKATAKRAHHGKTPVYPHPAQEPRGPQPSPGASLLELAAARCGGGGGATSLPQGQRQGREGSCSQAEVVFEELRRELLDAEGAVAAAPACIEGEGAPNPSQVHGHEQQGSSALGEQLLRSTKRKQPVHGGSSTTATAHANPPAPSEKEWGVAAASPDVVAALPLPPVLQQLEWAFATACRCHSFLTDAHIQVGGLAAVTDVGASIYCLNSI